MITYKELMEKKWVPVSEDYYKRSKNNLLEGKIDLSHWCKFMRTLKLVKFIMHCGMQHKSIDLTVGLAMELMLTKERDIYYPYWLDTMIKDYGYGEYYGFQFPGFTIEEELLYLCNHNNNKGYDLSTEDGKLEAAVRKKQIEKYDPACQNESEIISPVGDEVKKEDFGLQDKIGRKNMRLHDMGKLSNKELQKKELLRFVRANPKAFHKALSPDMIFEILDRCEFLQNSLESFIVDVLSNIKVDE